MDVREVERLLGADPDEYDEDFWYEWGWEEKGPKEEIPGLGSVELIANVGGEGQGDTRYMVFKVTFPDGSVRFFKKNGYYASYDGTTWDGDLHEVKPIERVVTFYE